MGWNEPLTRKEIGFLHDGCENQFKLLMIGTRHRKEIVIPTRQEMIGLEVMAQNDTLKNFVNRLGRVRK